MRQYLLFRHYYTADLLRLHAASFCKRHLLCPLCAIRRGAKALKAYLDRWEVIRAENPRLKPFLVTLTVKDGDDLAERFRHLHESQRALWMRKHRGRGCVLDGVAGAVWSYEVKRGQGSGAWHPHLHMIALAEVQPSQSRLSHEWESVTADSYIVDVRPISQEDTASGFCEVFKYALKSSDMEIPDTLHAFDVLRETADCVGGMFPGRRGAGGADRRAVGRPALRGDAVSPHRRALPLCGPLRHWGRQRAAPAVADERGSRDRGIPEPACGRGYAAKALDALESA